MRRFLLAAYLWLALFAPALAQSVVPVQMRDANLTTTSTQNLISTLNVFSAPRTLTLPGRGALSQYYIQFVDTANAISPTNTLTVQMADGGLINGAPTAVASQTGIYLFIIPNGSGYSAIPVAASAVTPPGGTAGQIQWNSAGVFAGFTASGDFTINTGTGVGTLTTVNANIGAFGSNVNCSSFTVNAKGLITAAAAVACTPAVGSITGLGTGVATALAINIGSAGAPVLFNGAGGTPSSIVLTNATGTAAGLSIGGNAATASAVAIGGITGMGTGCGTFLTTPSSANLRGCVSDETGTGLLYFQGGAAGTPSSITLTNGTGLPLSGLLAQAGSTLVANATTGSAVPTAVDISALTTKGSPTVSDWLLLSDQAAAGALKKAAWPAAGAGTVTSATVTAGTGVSTSGTCTSTSVLNCTVNQSLTNATVVGAVTAPTGTTSATQVMMGLGVSACRITPVYSGRLKVDIAAFATNSATNITVAQVRYGTGAGPANGAAATGTAFGQVMQATSPGAGNQTPFTLPAVITGLTPGTTYWLDLGFFTNGGTSTFFNVSCMAFEF